MYGPHSVTLFNVKENSSTLNSGVNATLLRGVLLDVAKGSNVRTSGLESADSATLYVPFSVVAVNAATGEEQKYISPTEYEALDDVSGYWTIRASGSGSTVDCFFAKGSISDVGTFKTINATHDYVFRVNAVDMKDFGTSDMRHWEVGGR